MLSMLFDIVMFNLKFKTLFYLLQMSGNLHSAMTVAAMEIEGIVKAKPYAKPLKYSLSFYSIKLTFYSFNIKWEMNL